MKNFKINEHSEEKIKSKIKEIIKNTLHTHSWDENIDTFNNNILNDNLNDFLNWSVITKTMFVGECLSLINEYEEIKNDYNNWEDILEESNIGNPKILSDKKTSGSIVHNFYNIYMFEKTTGIDISKIDNVVEFGGGYGCLCKLFYQKGFNGNYTIFDLPTLSGLQEFYLDNHNLDMKKIKCTSDIKHIKNDKNTLFIASWSLSEAPIELRNNILNIFNKDNNFLIIYSHTFDGIDNVEYFKNHKLFKNIKHSTHKHYPNGVYVIK